MTYLSLELEGRLREAERNASEQLLRLSHEELRLLEATETVERFVELCPELPLRQFPFDLFRG